MSKKVAVKQKNYRPILWVIAISITLIMLYLSIYPTDTDVYYIIAQGRDIINNGIPTTLYSFNFFPIDTVIQNYGWCVLLAFMYDLLGNIGLLLIQISIYIPISIIGCKILKINGYEGSKLSSYIITMILMSITYVNLRPQNITLLLLLLQLYVTLYVKKTKKYKYLLFIPLFVFCQMQVHMSMWVMHLIIALPFMCPFVIRTYDGTWHLEKNDFIEKTKDGKRKYLLLTVGLSVLALFINPYGIDGVTYIIKSMGVLDNFEIMELQPMTLAKGYGLIAITLFISFIVFRDKLKGYEIWMTIGLLVMATESIRNIIFLPIAWFMIMPYIIKNTKMKDGIFIIPLVIISTTTMISMVEAPTHLSNELYVENFAVLDEVLEHIPDKDSKICAGFATGNYLEFKGYKTFFDARPEIYSSKINNTADIGNDWLGLVSPDEHFKEIIDFYGFDYIIATPYKASYYAIKETEEYDIEYQNEENTIVLFKKKAINNE